MKRRSSFAMGLAGFLLVSSICQGADTRTLSPVGTEEETFGFPPPQSTLLQLQEAESRADQVFYQQLKNVQSLASDAHIAIDNNNKEQLTHAIGALTSLSEDLKSSITVLQRQAIYTQNLVNSEVSEEAESLLNEMKKTTRDYLHLIENIDKSIQIFINQTVI
jgi:predicted nucleotidyltransferase